MRWSLAIRSAARATLIVLAAVAVARAQAQQTTGKSEDDKSEAIEEIIVYGGKKPGDELDVQALYEAELRARLMKDLEELQQEEQKNRWRSATAGIPETPSRIKWGYDPEAEARMRRETDLMDVQYETVKPASLFRFEF